MIDFTLNDEHRLLEQSIREWARSNVAPFIRDNDRKHHFDRDRFGGMAKLGLLGISVPQNTAAPAWTHRARHRERGAQVLDTSLRVIMSVHAGLNCLTS